jgi:hypothetical protein
MPLLTLQVNNPSTALEKQQQEVALIQRALHLATMDIRGAGGKKTSGNIMDDGAKVIGSWIFVPQASS